MRLNRYIASVTFLDKQIVTRKAGIFDAFPDYFQDLFTISKIAGERTAKF